MTLNRFMDTSCIGYRGKSTARLWEVKEFGEDPELRLVTTLHRALAFCSLLPGFSPTSRCVVFAVIEELTFPPRLPPPPWPPPRVKCWKLPVTHQV